MTIGERGTTRHLWGEGRSERNRAHDDRTRNCEERRGLPSERPSSDDPCCASSPCCSRSQPAMLATATRTWQSARPVSLTPAALRVPSAALCARWRATLAQQARSPLRRIAPATRLRIRCRASHSFRTCPICSPPTQHSSTTVSPSLTPTATASSSSSWPASARQTRPLSGTRRAEASTTLLRRRCKMQAARPLAWLRATLTATALRSCTSSTRTSTRAARPPPTA